MSALELVYRGSHKEVLRPSGSSDRFWLGFSEKDTITSKAEALISAFIFEHLASADNWHAPAVAKSLQPFNVDWVNRRRQHLIYSHVISEHGLPTHFQQLVDTDGKKIAQEDAAQGTSPYYLEVTKVEFNCPQSCTFNNQSIYYYPYRELDSKFQMVPLDIFFHCGLPEGSLLAQRLKDDPTYSKRLGLEKPPIPLSWFERPVLEYSARFEDSKRILNLQEALLISGLTAGQFEEMIETSYNVALALQAMFSKVDLILWSGKLQYAISKEGLILINTIGPRELVIGFADLLLPGYDLNQIQTPSKYTDQSLLGTTFQVIANQVAGKQLFTELPDLQELSQRLRKAN